MDKETYSKEAMKFAAYDDSMYPFWAILEELGEFAGKIAKSLRGDKELDMVELRKEAGDVLWQLNAREFEESCTGNELYWDFLEVVDYTINSNSLDGVNNLFNLYIQKHFNMDPSEIRQENIDKLTDRKNRNVIKGSGDNR